MFHLIQYSHNMMILSCNQYKKYWDRLRIFICVLNLYNLGYIFPLWHISAWASHISCAQWPHGSSGYRFGPCRPRIILTRVLIAVETISVLYVHPVIMFSGIIMYYFFHRKNNQRNFSIYWEKRVERIILVSDLTEAQGTVNHTDHTYTQRTEQNFQATHEEAELF